MFFEIEDGLRFHSWARDLFPINRSLTGEGVRQTLRYIQKLFPQLTIKGVPSGTSVLDWTVPKEWYAEDAYIITPSGQKICDFKQLNVHLMGYSIPVNQKMTLEQLQPHLYDIPSLPTAVPYVTSYYKENWGFCLSTEQRAQLEEGEYQVVIKSKLFDGELNYGELILPGESEQEILLSTYICHPSLANNELSGPVVSMAIIEKLLQQSKRRFTYRILFVPETIGAISYLASHLSHLKKKLAAGFVVTCIGDERAYSYLASRDGNTLADRAAKSALKSVAGDYKSYHYLQRGSDERQYCAPGVDLPVCSIMRSKYGEYPEYHTSLDDLTLVTPKGLQGGADALWAAIVLLENNYRYKTTVLGEPQLGKRGLYPSVSDMQQDYSYVVKMTNLLAYADGTMDLLEIAELIQVSPFELLDIADKLVTENLLEVVD
ncbi:DUF4910 domain-containing protein [Pseudoalteromonas sp. T1lg65]|uniref:DUF4910 domain-containing protein n=1 Tax=Pseudoalteromonas sp. T1lg65 TaxID=2077101 RepID=UPI003F7983EE